MKPKLSPLRWIVLVLVLVLVGLQVVPVDRTNPPVQTALEAPAEVDEILRRACYDCHSHETRWPWYSYVAPVSWFVVGHVNHGRGDINFSEWPVFDFELQEHAFRDIEEQIEKGEMPLRSYKRMHRDAELDEQDRETLLRWARSRGNTH